MASTELLQGIRAVLIGDTTLTGMVPASRIYVGFTQFEEKDFQTPAITIDVAIGDSDPKLPTAEAIATVVVWTKKDPTESVGSRRYLHTIGERVDYLLNKELDAISDAVSGLDVHKFLKANETVDYLDDIRTWAYALDYRVVFYDPAKSEL